MKKKKKVLIVLAGGGFLGQVKQILKNIETDTFDINYVTANDSTMILKDFDESRCFVMPKTTHFSQKNTLKRLSSLYTGLKYAKDIIIKVKPDIVISVGSSMSVPLFFWAKKIGAKNIFIESLTRVKDLSRTGKILYFTNLSSRLYVQWADIHKKYPRAIYKGKIL